MTWESGPNSVQRFDIAAMRVTDATLLQDQMFQNFFVYTRQDTNTMVALYRLARTESEELLRLIKEELGETPPFQRIEGA